MVNKFVYACITWILPPIAKTKETYTIVCSAMATLINLSDRLRIAARF
ncbi:MAG: hypothetical protein KKB34_15265 [Bacteroidetes bacterium]|nr:hypothetical protein [Bacteroidota bacterium]